MIKNFVDRIIKLEEEKKEIQADIKEVYKEAHDKGYDKKAIRSCIRLLKMEKTEREEFIYLFDTYRNELDL